jgi:O-antigen ligase
MKLKDYFNVLKVGIFASFAVFVFVFPGLLFPYITSKQISFNILMEIMLVFWLVMIVKFPQVRPKKSYITYGLLAYFGAILISCLISFDFNLSFWGNAERMLGFFHLAHFLIFYLVLITVFRKKSDWSNLMNVFIAVTVFIVLIGLLKNYSASTVGNDAYVAGLMIFGLFFSLWQLIINKEKAKLWLYIVAMFILLVGFVRSDISGSQVGLVAGVLGGGFLYSLLQKNKKLKIISISALAVLVIGLGLLLNFRSSSVFDDTKIGSMLRAFSSDNVTWNTRLMSWKSAYRGFGDHPIFGTGYGTFGVVFDKYFDTKFYDLTPNETYFDRAHNNLIDITSSTGLIGLITYLSIFVAVFYYLGLAYKNGKISAVELSLLAGIIIAYFVHNLAVFDALVNYIAILLVLGLVYYATGPRDEEVKDEVGVVSPEREFGWLVFLGIVMLVIIFKYNIKGFTMFNNVIKSYTIILQGDIKAGVDSYKNALANEAPYNRDSRSTLINLIIGNAEALGNMNKETRNEIFDYTIGLAKENVAYDTYDSLLQWQLARISTVAARYNMDDLKKLNEYSAEALVAIDYSIESSPGRMPAYFAKGDVHMLRGEKDEAVVAILEGIKVKPDYPNGYCQLANFNFFYKDYEKSYENAYDCVKNGGISLLNNMELINKTVQYYSKDSDKIEIIEVLKAYLAENDTSTNATEDQN